MFAAEEIALSRSMGRFGRFVIVHQSIETSARKLWTHSLLEILQVLMGVLIRGRAALRERAGLELWYGARREEFDQRDATRSERTAD